VIQDSYAQNQINYGLGEWNEVTESSSQNSSYWKEQTFSKRRQTLFNLYAFTYSDSYQKNLSSDQTVKANDDYTIPTLDLENVEFRNFLYDYQSLIYIENDNFLNTSGKAVAVKLSTEV